MTSVSEETSGVQTIASHARLVAALLDTFPEGIEPPTHFHINSFRERPEVAWLIFDEKDQKARAAAIVKALGGKWDKRPGTYFAFDTVIGGVDLHISVDRAEVCEAVVTGQREVTKTEVVESREVTVTEDIVEWRCAPLLSEVSS